MVNGKAWIMSVLAHDDTASVPFNVTFTPPVVEALCAHYGVTDIAAHLDLPVRMTGLRSIKPLYASPDIYGSTIEDEFGVVWSTSTIDRGSPIIPCLTEPDLSDYRFPSAALSYRFDQLDEWCESNKQFFTGIWVGDLWERATFMRGMEEILLDLAIDPDFVHELLRGLTDRILETMGILFDRFSFDAIALSDDYGTQRSMLMSPDAWRKFVKPLLAEIYSYAKENGRLVFHHSCGNIYPIIGDMIDIGLDILHPIQPEAMDVFQLKREFGKRITFCGGVRTQDLLVNGTPEAVRAEVCRLKREMGRGGGYILEPGITVQADVPLQNVVAMIDEATQSPDTPGHGSVIG